MVTYESKPTAYNTHYEASMHFLAFLYFTLTLSLFSLFASLNLPHIRSFLILFFVFFLFPSAQHEVTCLGVAPANISIFLLHLSLSISFLLLSIAWKHKLVVV